MGGEEGEGHVNVDTGDPRTEHAVEDLVPVTRNKARCFWHTQRPRSQDHTWTPASCALSGFRTDRPELA